MTTTQSTPSINKIKALILKAQKRTPKRGLLSSEAKRAQKELQASKEEAMAVFPKLTYTEEQQLLPLLKKPLPEKKA